MLKKSSLFIADYNRFLFVLQIVHDHGQFLVLEKTVNFLAGSVLIIHSVREVMDSSGP